MKIRFTPKVAYRMIERAKRTFCRYPSSTISSDLKATLKQLQVFIVINPKLKVTWGTGAFVRIRQARRLFKIPKEFPPTKVDSVLGYFVIEINPKLVVISSPCEVYDTLSHELAHCLDFKIRGYYGRDNFHDEYWSFLHKRMGGDGEEFYKGKSTFAFKYTTRKAKAIKKHFENIDKTNKDVE
jgi:hypothetical protein